MDWKLISNVEGTKFVQQILATNKNLFFGLKTTRFLRTKPLIWFKDPHNWISIQRTFKSSLMQTDSNNNNIKEISIFRKYYGGLPYNKRKKILTFDFFLQFLSEIVLFQLTKCPIYHPSVIHRENLTYSNDSLFCTVEEKFT